MAFGKDRNFWSVGKLVIGIISVVLSFVIGLQSFTVLIDNALSPNKDMSGMIGFLVAFLILIAGIVGIITQNSKELGGTIACIALYGISTMTSFFVTITFLSLKIWGVIALLFALVHLFSLIYSKKDMEQY